MERVVLVEYRVAHKSASSATSIHCGVGMRWWTYRPHLHIHGAHIRVISGLHTQQGRQPVVHAPATSAGVHCVAGGAHNHICRQNALQGND